MSFVDLVAGAIIPVVALLAAGFILNTRFLRNKGLWHGLERLSYFVFTPALFISSISSADLTVVPFGSMLITLVIPLSLTALVIAALKRPLRATGPDLTSLIQGGIRMNTYMGLIISQAIGGAQGVAAFALACAVVVPTVNLISVTGLSIYGASPKGGRAGRPSVVASLAKNPFLLASLAGIALNVAPFDLPRVVAEPIALFAEPAMVIGTLVSGAALKFAVTSKEIVHISVASIIKLLLLPLATAAMGSALGLEGAALAAVITITAIPTAPSAYVLATIMGGNARLMANITGVQTVLSIVTLPMLLFALL